MAGRGGSYRADIYIEGLYSFLNAAAKADSRFNFEMRKAGERVADELVTSAQMRAYGPYGKVWLGLRARRDRIPTIKLDGNKNFRNKRKRSKPAKMSDIFFGAEFGGRARPTTQQFLPHRGRGGYVFWPTVRDKQQYTAEQYLNAIDEVLDMLSRR